MSSQKFTNLSERIQWLINECSLSQAEFADMLGISAGYVSQLLSGERTELSKQLTKLISYVFCVPEEWICSGKEPIEVKKNTYRYKLDQSGISEQNEKYLDFVFINQVRGEISAGGGLVPDNVIEMRIAFRKDWIEHRGDPENMSLIRVSGDSMEPTLFSGDLVLVDHGRNYIDPQGGIYAVAIDHQIMIKRIQLLLSTEKVVIISDNEKYRPIEIDSSQIKINGKIIWFGREIER